MIVPATLTPTLVSLDHLCYPHPHPNPTIPCYMASQEGVPAFRRKYTNEVRRCNEMMRKLRWVHYVRMVTGGMVTKGMVHTLRRVQYLRICL